MAENITKTQTSGYTWANSKALNWSHADVRDRSWRNMGVFLYVAMLSEQLSIAEAIKKTSHAKCSEAIKVVDNRPVFFASAGLKEAFGLTDAVAKNLSTIQEEMLFVAELAANALHRALNESFSLEEYYKQTYHLQESRSLNFAEVREGLEIGQHHRSTISIAENVANSFIQKLAESLEMAGSARKAYELYHDHEIGFTEVREGLNIGQVHSESLKVAEINSNQIGREFESRLTFEEARFQKGVLKEVESLLAILEAHSFNFDTKVSEILKIGETPSNKPIKGFSSKFGIDSDHGKGYSVNNEENLMVSDATNRTAAFIRTIVEELAILDEVAKNQAIKLAEELKVLDAFLRKADVILADMVLSTLAAGEDIDLDAFENLVTNGAMPGYTNWRDFIPGDYEYTKALFRTIIESKTADRAQIQQLDVAVDVPDLQDRGTVIVTNATAGGVVEFNKDFHVIPDVTLSAKGGLNNPTVPEFLVAPNLNGFTVRLRDTITGSYVTGSFTWTAIGY